MLFSMEKYAHLALPLSVLPHRFGIIIIIYNFTNKEHYANIFSAVTFKKTYEVIQNTLWSNITISCVVSCRKYQFGMPQF